MAKLDEGTAQRTAGWEITDGIYELEFVRVETKDKQGQKFIGKESGVPYWRWIFAFPKDANSGRWALRELTKVISEGESSDGMRLEAFNAIGCDPGEDTDAYNGRVRVMAQVRVSTYNGSPRPEINSLYPKGAASLVTEPNGAASVKGRGKANAPKEDETANF